MQPSDLILREIGRLSFDPSISFRYLHPEVYVAEGIVHETFGPRPTEFLIKRCRNTVTIREGEDGTELVSIKGKDDHLAWSEVVHALQDSIRFHPRECLAWGIGCADVNLVQHALADADPNEPNLFGLLPLDAATLSAGCRADAMRLTFDSLGDAHPSSESLFAHKMQDFSALELIRLALLASGAIDQGPFRDAVRSGRLDEAEGMLACGVQIDALTLNRIPLLVERILHKDTNAVTWLLINGADPQWRPLHPLSHSLPASFAQANPDLRKRCSKDFVITPATATLLTDWPQGLETLRHFAEIKPARILSDLANSQGIPSWFR